jgi:hypothetical protein
VRTPTQSITMDPASISRDDRLPHMFLSLFDHFTAPLLQQALDDAYRLDRERGGGMSPKA